MKNKEKLKEKAVAFLQLIRIRNSAMTFLGVLLGAFFINYETVLSFKILIAAVAAFLITAAGNAINDYFDYDIDRINRPERPLPSNRIRKSDAMMLSLLMFVVGVGLSKYVNDFCLILATVNSLILIYYGRFSKRMYLLSNLVVAYLVGSIFFYGALANTLEISSEMFELVGILAACAFFATLAREVIKDIEDMAGDKKEYAATIPIRIGEKRAHEVASFFVAVSILISFLPFFTAAGFNLLFYGFLIVLADLSFLLALTLKPAGAQKMMILGMSIALLAFFFGELKLEVLF